MTLIITFFMIPGVPQHHHFDSRCTSLNYSFFFGICPLIYSVTTLRRGRMAQFLFRLEKHYTPRRKCSERTRKKRKKGSSDLLRHGETPHKIRLWTALQCKSESTSTMSSKMIFFNTKEIVTLYLCTSLGQDPKSELNVMQL